jgi:HPt (histidine-containing phosphotransfer) domain-containing protein
MASDRDACLEAGMNNHIGKPFDLNHLVSVLLKHAGSHTPVLPALPANTTLSLDRAAPAQSTDALLDSEAALQRLSGMTSLYVKLAREFHADLQDTVLEYRRLIAASLPKDAVRHLHTLKGTAATLGAMRLSEFARALEAHWKDNAQGALKDHQADELEWVVESTRAALAQVIAQFGETKAKTTRDAAKADSSGVADVQGLLAELDGLESLLKHSDLQALDRFATLRSQLEDLELDHFPALEQAFQDLDLPAALVACRTIATQLGSVNA